MSINLPYKKKIKYATITLSHIIKCSDEVKDLGVILASKLTMVDNIQSVTRKAYFALANIGKI